MNILLICSLNISPDSWIQLVSGLGAVVVALLAIIHGNKNSRKALEQQNGIIQYQHNEKRLDEYNGCLRDNLELLNFVDVVGPMVYMSHEDYSQTRREICSRKSKIYSYDLRFKYLFSNGGLGKTCLLKEYEASWDEATKTLSVLLDKMLDYVNYLSQYAAENEIMKNLNQQIEIYSSMIELDMNNSSQYSLEIESLRSELIELSLRQSKFKDTVDKFTEDIQVLINELRNQSVVLFQLSQQLMKELQDRLLDKSK